MNTETKTEWRLVPVPATQKMSEAGMATFIITSAHEKEIDIDVMFEAMCNAAPTPQAKPCERCAELEADREACHRGMLREIRLKRNEKVKVVELSKKLAALEAEKAKLLRVTRQQAEASAAILNEKQAIIAQQTKARKQAQADLETYKGRCTDLEHQNERLKAENERGDAAANEIDRLRSDLSTAKAAGMREAAKICYNIASKYEDEDLSAIWCMNAILDAAEKLDALSKYK